MPSFSRKPLSRVVTIRPRAATLAALLPLLGAAALSVPAKAATVSCQAVTATGIISGNVPTGACNSPVNINDTFEIDFTSVFNATDFSVNNTYSLQIANINPAGSTLSFENVELLVTGKFGTTDITTPTAISIWQSPVTLQTGQGIANYQVNGSGQDFGLGVAYKSANFDLTSPASPGTFGPAGVINTIPVNLFSAGITEFNSVLIRGKLANSNITRNSFAAGLGIYTSNNPATQAPNIIYGNAFNAVPGPLPIVGAGAAFGWSRRLRKRVRKSAAVGSVA